MGFRATPCPPKQSTYWFKTYRFQMNLKAGRSGGIGKPRQA